MKKRIVKLFVASALITISALLLVQFREQNSDPTNRLKRAPQKRLSFAYRLPNPFDSKDEKAATARRHTESAEAPTMAEIYHRCLRNDQDALELAEQLEKFDCSVDPDQNDAQCNELLNRFNRVETLRNCLITNKYTGRYDDGNCTGDFELGRMVGRLNCVSDRTNPEVGK